MGDSEAIDCGEFARELLLERPDLGGKHLFDLSLNGEADAQVCQLRALYLILGDSDRRKNMACAFLRSSASPLPAASSVRRLLEAKSSAES
jgi:hypothetical protein